jgi:hypothetical protein
MPHQTPLEKETFNHGDAVRVSRLTTPLVQSWIQRGMVHGMSGRGPGVGVKRAYSTLAVLSLAGMSALTEISIPAQAASDIIGDVWAMFQEEDAVGLSAVQHVWVILGTRNGKAAVEVMLSPEGVVPPTKPTEGARLTAILDLAPVFQSTLDELQAICAERDKRKADTVPVGMMASTIYGAIYASTN